MKKKKKILNRFKLAKGIVVKEQSSIKRDKTDCRGYIIDEGSKTLILIKRSISSEEKLLTFFHEICHWIQNRKEEGYNDEKIAFAFEKIMYYAFLRYPELKNGVENIKKE